MAQYFFLTLYNKGAILGGNRVAADKICRCLDSENQSNGTRLRNRHAIGMVICAGEVRQEGSCRKV